MLSTMKNRAEAVAQANANSALEGHEPDAGDLAMQALFVSGEMSLEDMLEEIRLQAAAAAGTDAGAGGEQ